MFKQDVDVVSGLSVKKADMLKSGRLKYVVISMLAGIFVGFGVIISNTLGGLFKDGSLPQAKIAMGLSFGGALSLVIMAGAELFTGNNMVMTIGAFEKDVSLKDTLKVWFYSYIGNFIGSFVLAFLFVMSGMAKGNTGTFILKSAASKMTAPFLELVFRGILCNMLVCIAVWCSFKMKNEAAKLIIIFWCLFTFVAAGFEHSVANMTLFSIALLIPHTVPVSITGLLYNLLAVTIGNMIGGALLVGFPYWYSSCKHPQAAHNKFNDEIRQA